MCCLEQCPRMLSPFELMEAAILSMMLSCWIIMIPDGFVHFIILNLVAFKTKCFVVTYVPAEKLKWEGNR